MHESYNCQNNVLALLKILFCADMVDFRKLVKYIYIYIYMYIYIYVYVYVFTINPEKFVVINIRAKKFRVIKFLS